jgi:hypothetical protein
MEEGVDRERERLWRNVGMRNVEREKDKRWQGRNYRDGVSSPL